MKHIKRLPEPNILVRKKNEWTNKFIASDKKRPDDSKYGHHEIKTTLFTMSHNKCYYCEGLLKGKSKEIDHLIEVSENKHLAFEWTNLFLSCDNCNNKIPNRILSVSDVLNPCEDTDDEIEKHISFENEQITFLTDKGEKTIKKFRLSTERLDYLRIKQLQSFTEKLITIQKRMNQDGRKKMSETEKDSLKRFAKADSRYSLMFAKYLKKHNIT
jgi:uncharacterized protein (TIGR02646 family)